MVSQPCSESKQETQIKSGRIHCIAPGRRLHSDGWAELEYLDYSIRKRPDS